MWHMTLQLWCSVVAAHGLSCSMACETLVPQLGTEPTSSLYGRFLITAPPRKPPLVILTITTQLKNKKHPITFRMLTSKLGNILSFLLDIQESMLLEKTTGSIFLLIIVSLASTILLVAKQTIMHVFEWMNGLLCQCSECYFRYFHIY